MCDFASFWARLNGKKLEIARWDWLSHSRAQEELGLKLSTEEEWSECEWTGKYAESLAVRHTDSKKATELKAAVICEFVSRSALLSKHMGKVCGVREGDFCWCDATGQRHREDGPAIVRGTWQAWYRNDKRHREDGPAIVDGTRQEWYRNGQQFSPKNP